MKVAELVETVHAELKEQKDRYDEGLLSGREYLSALATTILEGLEKAGGMKDTYEE